MQVLAYFRDETFGLISKNSAMFLEFETTSMVFFAISLSLLKVKYWCDHRCNSNISPVRISSDERLLLMGYDGVDCRSP